MSNNGYIIETCDLTKSFLIKRRGERHKIMANDHINLCVGKGECLGIIGPNGAGKTTFLKLLCGLLVPTEGTAIVDGCNVAKVGHKINRTSLGAVFPTIYNWSPRQTIKEFLEFEGIVCGVQKSILKRQIDSLIGLMGLDKWADEFPTKISSGNQRKVLLCAALIRDPPILLFDEPTIHLDPVIARDFWNVIKDLCSKKGKTILLTTQNMDEANFCCDRIAFLRNGRIIALDAPDRLKKALREESVIEVGVTKSNPDLKLKLEKLPCVLRVETFLSAASTRFRLYVHPNTNSVPDIVETIVGDGERILFLREEKMTLDDVFVKLAG